MAVDAFIQVPLDSTGKMVDNSSLSVGANTVLRQRGNISSPTDANGHAEVKNVAPAQTDYGLLVRIVPPTNSKYHVVAAAGTNAASIKVTGGNVMLARIFNNAAYPIYVKLFNKATAPVPGTDTPVETIGVQAGMSYTQQISSGDNYATGIGIAITKGIADNDATAVALNDCVVDLEYV